MTWDGGVHESRAREQSVIYRLLFGGVVMKTANMTDDVLINAHRPLRCSLSLSLPVEAGMDFSEYAEGNNTSMSTGVCEK